MPVLYLPSESPEESLLPFFSNHLWRVVSQVICATMSGVFWISLFTHREKQMEKQTPCCPEQWVIICACAQYVQNAVLPRQVYYLTEFSQVQMIIQGTKEGLREQLNLLLLAVAQRRWREYLFSAWLYYLNCFIRWTKTQRRGKNGTGQTDWFFFSSLFLTKVKHPDDFTCMTCFGGLTFTVLLQEE